jgi:hypothetical protein
MKFDWLRVCPPDVTTDCIGQGQVIYLAALVAGIVLLAVLARRSRDLSTATLSLMPVAIAINIAVGALAVALRLPIYLDSIGTVLVGVLAGPWAGALTGILANLIWSILPVPGGAGPLAAFFAPVAGVIGLLAGFWARQGVFRLRSDDDRVGLFLSLASGVGAAVVAMIVFRQAGLLTFNADDVGSQNRFVAFGLLIVLIGIVVGWLCARTIFRFQSGDPRIGRYLAIGTGVATFAFAFVLVSLVFAPGGYFSIVDGTDPDGEGPLSAPWGGADLRGLVWPWPWSLIVPIAAGVFGGVTGAGTDLLVAAYRTLGLNIFQSVLAQGLTSDPFDKTLSYTVVFVILVALPVTVRTMFSRGEEAVAA